MKEIGGYVELEYNHGTEYHQSAIRLNCGRNCLAYLIEVYDIKKIYLPYFLCNSVGNVCKKYSVEIVYYHINENFTPIIPSNYSENAWFYLVNFYGQITNEQIMYNYANIKKLIVDNAQAFFQLPLENIPTIYTCRKFFGVTDGAYLYCNKRLERSLEKDISYERMSFLLGRFEKTASEFYSEYTNNNKLFATEPIKEMSKLTLNLMCGIDYNFVKNQRTSNFNYLKEQLKESNKLKLIGSEGDFAYPLLLEKGAEVRKKLQLQKIYIPTLWSDVFDICDETMLEYNYAKNILPLPCDQRYNEKDMNYLVKEI